MKLIYVSFLLLTTLFANEFNPKLAQSFTYKVEVYNSDKEQISFGTAVALSSNGKLITAYHVINNQKYIKVIDNNGISYKAKLGKVSLKNDLAYLYIDVKNIPFVKIADNVALGDEIYILSYDSLLLKGIVSKNNTNAIFINLDVEEGTSGGGVFNKSNELIAILLRLYPLNKVSYAVKTNMFNQINEEYTNKHIVLKDTNNYNTAYCENKDDLKIWAKNAKSNNLKVQEYHALFIGLCQKVKNHDLTTDEAQIIFENARLRLFNE